MNDTGVGGAVRRVGESVSLRLSEEADEEGVVTAQREDTVDVEVHVSQSVLTGLPSVLVPPP